MEKCKLGTLPEALRAWSKFRPADVLDFKRRAKNLSLVLELPLQKTQDAFALACGYSGKHEILKVLEQADSPGPYDDDIPQEILDEVSEAYALVQLHRHARLLSAVEALIDTVPKRYFGNRDTTVCDLDLFSTPARHRASAKDLIHFLAGESSGCTFDGFPYGYRGTVHRRYLYLDQMQIDDGALHELVEGLAETHSGGSLLFDPRDQARAQLRYRAPKLFVGMADKTAAPLVARPHELELDFDCVGEDDSDLTRLLLGDVDRQIVYMLADIDLAEEEFERLHSAVSSPTQEKIQGSAVASAIPDFADQIPKWRLSLRYQWAKELQNPDYFGWGGKDFESTLILDSHDRDGGYGEGWIPDAAVRWLSVLMQRRDVDLDQVHWKVTATLLLQESDEKAWKPVALLTGDHIVAAKDHRYSGPDEVEMHCDDYGDTRLSEAWKLLTKLYMPVAGYLSYHEWVNNDWDGGGVAAILDPWVAPSFRGSEVSRWLLEGYARAFDDGTGYCRDSMWQDYLDPRCEGMGEMTDDEDTSIMGPGVILIPLPGSRMLGYSVWEADRDEPTTKVLRFNGQRMGLRTRWGRSEPIKGGLGPRMMDVAKSIEADIVLFDPDDAGDENE